MEILCENLKVLLAHLSFFAEFDEKGIPGLVEVADEFWGDPDEDIDCREGDDPEAAQLDERPEPAEIDGGGGPRGKDARDACQDSPGRKFCLEDHGSR